MILAEPFKCTVPSDDAVKHTEITCIGRSPDNYEYLGTVSDWLLVILTIILAIAAIYAGRKANQTLQQMRHEADEARDAERNIRAIAAFDQYAKALINICDKFPNESNADFSAWHRSRAQYFPYLSLADWDMRAMAEGVNELIEELFSAHTVAKSDKKPKFLEYKHLIKESRVVMIHLPDCALEMTRVLAAWHVGASSKESALDELKEQSVRLKGLLNDPLAYN